MKSMFRRLRPLGTGWGLALSRRRRHAESPRGEGAADVPCRVYPDEAGWLVCTESGIRCHRFTAWYDECRLLPGGHAELTRRQGGNRTVHRFRWCAETRRYRPDHAAGNAAA